MRTLAHTVLLATNKVPALGQIFTAMGLSIRDSISWAEEDEWGCHLYITVNEHIHKGDWFIAGEKLQRATEYMGVHLNGAKCKVIASTDTMLGLPVIDRAFVLDYVAAEGKINEVEIQKVDNGTIYLWQYTEAKPGVPTTQEAAVAYADEKTNKVGYWKPIWQAHYDAYLSVNDWQRKQK